MFLGLLYSFAFTVLNLRPNSLRLLKIRSNFSCRVLARINSKRLIDRVDNHIVNLSKFDHRFFSVPVFLIAVITVCFIVL